jgi:hypothetical protein
MPMVEVDELQLQQSNRLKQTMETWLRNPKAKRKILEAQKLVDPKADIPELDEVDPVEEIRASTAKEIADLKKELADKDAARERDGRIAQLQAMKDTGIKKLREGRYTDEGIKAVEKIMEEKGILDPLDAAAIFERDHPPQAPVQQSGTGSWNFGELPSSTDDADEKYVDQLLKGGKNDISDGVLSQRISQTINEVRGNARH